MGAADFDDVGELFGFGVEASRDFSGRAGGGARFSVAAAMCLAAGNVSLEDCDMFTSSFGWIGFLLPRMPPQFQWRG